MENRNQQLQNRQAERRNTPWFAYLLVGIGLGLTAGILIKMISPSLLEIRLNNDQWNTLDKRLSDLCYQICSLGRSLTKTGGQCSC